MLLNERNRGVAMIYALLLLVVVAGLGTLMAARAVDEIRHSADDAAIVQSLMLARGGANISGAVLQGPIRDSLDALVQQESSTSSRWSFGSGSGEEPEPPTVVNALTRGGGSVAAILQEDIDDTFCGQELLPGSGVGEITVRLHVTDEACGKPLPNGVKLPSGRFVTGQPRNGSGSSAEQTYAIPFVLVSEGKVGVYGRNVVLQGEYQFTVGRASFARYALFTNVHELGSSGGNVWFTDNTLFDGPVHTNQYLRFYRRPWFGGKVTSAGCRDPLQTSCYGDNYSRRGANFYGQGFTSYWNMNNPTSPSYSNKYGTHAPELSAGVDWSATFVPLPQNSQDQEAASKDKGLYFDDDLHSLKLWAADLSGDPLESDGLGGWTETATFQYIEACTSSSNCDTYRYANDGVLYEHRVVAGVPTWVPQGLFNGMIYSDDDIHRVTGPERSPASSTDPADAPPALAAFSQITIASEDFMRITGDLTYEDKPCSGAPTRDGDGNVQSATCDNLDATNVLGLYAQEGDILIGNNNGDDSKNAPDNVAIQAVLMSGESKVTVEDYDQGSPRGQVNLLGGIIEYYYGAFGRFNSGTGSGVSGYGRKITYDRRMAEGLSPPFFPTVGDDTVKDVLVFSFGQREQIY